MASAFSVRETAGNSAFVNYLYPLRQERAFILIPLSSYDARGKFEEQERSGRVA